MTAPPPTPTPAESAPSATLVQRIQAAGFWVVARAFRWSPEWLAYGIADTLAPILVFGWQEIPVGVTTPEQQLVARASPGSDLFEPGWALQP